MGEPLYDEVVGKAKLDRPCRIYAPVGTHETLLAYLVRRLLENGANSSFVNRIADPDVLDRRADRRSGRSGARDARRRARSTTRSRCPRDLYRAVAATPPGSTSRTKTTLAMLSRCADAQRARIDWTAARMPRRRGDAAPVLNPGRPSRCRRHGRRDHARSEAPCRGRRCAAAASEWARRPARRARRTASNARPIVMQARMPTLLGLIVREAGKSLPNAIAEVREAIDFLRYYAAAGADARSGRRTRRSARSSASARGTSRWRSSPARSPRRWSPAIRCSPSPPRKRR